MSVYDQSKSAVDKIMPKFKQGTIELLQVTIGTNGKPYLPNVSEGVRHTLNATSRGVPYKYIDGRLIKTGDLEVVSSVLSNVTPTMEDRIIISGAKYRIIAFKPVPPSGTIVAWRFIVRLGV